jgi:hypothetical protein
MKVINRGIPLDSIKGLNIDSMLPSCQIADEQVEQGSDECGCVLLIQVSSFGPEGVCWRSSSRVGRSDAEEVAGQGAPPCQPSARGTSCLPEA